MTTRIVFDLEANGFLYYATQVWCICAKDVETHRRYQFYGPTIQEGLTLLSDYDIIIGHNIHGYDIPLLERLYPGWVYKDSRDTYCMSKLFNPERKQGHSLESYGIQFGKHKPVHEDWTQFSPEMLHRCQEDVEINDLLYKYLVDTYCTGWSWKDSLLLEQEFSRYQAYQELEGVDIDIPLAHRLIEQLDYEVDMLTKELLQRIPKTVSQVGTTVNKPFKKDGTYSARTKEFLCSCT